MARRSAKLLRFENTLYKYNTEAQTWSIDTINLNQLDKQIDISEKGTYASCKRMSQKINPILLRKGFLDAWDCLPYIDYNETKTLNRYSFYMPPLIPSPKHPGKLFLHTNLLTPKTLMLLSNHVTLLDYPGH